MQQSVSVLHVYILFHILFLLGCYKILRILPCAILQVLVGYLSYIEQGVHVGLPRWRLPMQEMQEPSVRSLGCEGSLEWKTATRSSILAWEVPWMEEPGAQAVESQGIGQV